MKNRKSRGGKCREAGRDWNEGRKGYEGLGRERLRKEKREMKKGEEGTKKKGMD